MRLDNRLKVTREVSGRTGCRQTPGPLTPLPLPQWRSAGQRPPALNIGSQGLHPMVPGLKEHVIQVKRRSTSHNVL